MKKIKLRKFLLEMMLNFLINDKNDNCYKKYMVIK